MLDYFDLQTVTLRGMYGKSADVPALTYGPFAVCYALDRELSVCHIPSGQRIRKVTTLLAGTQFVALLNGLNIDWQAIDPNWESESIAKDYPHAAEIYRRAMDVL